MDGIKDKRRKDIIDAALEVFGTYGFHKAKMGEIAERAGIGKGTIYEYFSSKKDLFEEMLKSIVDIYFERASIISQEVGTVNDKLVSFARYHGSFMGKYSKLVENTIRETEAVSDEMKNYLLKKKINFFNSMKNLLKEGINREELRKDVDNDIVVCMILGTIMQTYAAMIHHGKNDQDLVDPELVVELLLRGIGKKDS